MSLADHEIDYPDPCTDFTCHLCGDVKPIDDLAPQAKSQYEFGVCWMCWEEVEPAGVSHNNSQDEDDYA